MMRRLAALALIACATRAAAGDLVVEVRAAGGAPVPNAVVMLYPAGRPAALGPARAFQIVQRDLQFSPFVLVVPRGSQVAFPNHDPVRHHVYSFSPVRRFELRLYAREQSRSIQFDQAGFVPIGCNIHDGMIAYIAVADTGFAARTDGSGRVAFTGVPAGAAVARVWHPWLRAPGNRLEQRWTMPRSGRQTQAVTVALRAPPRAARNY